MLGTEKVSEYEHLSHKELLLGCRRVPISACPTRLHADRQHLAGGGPGSENWTQTGESVENTPLGKVVFNVVTPTLTLYLPEKGKATGTGIIVAPGGSCVALAIEHEGTRVASGYRKKGIAAFVLKYRIPEKKGEGIPQGH